MNRDKIISKILEDIAKKYNLPLHMVEDIYESQWDFIYKTMLELELDKVSEEEFNKLKTNFNVPALGKFYTNYKRIENVRRKSEGN